ncbi:MAG: 4-(cytidine 5'-diphospho)-2-C-methyl-D-erythritol kinase, partial [Thiohalorhabdaceae bacterium]
MWQDGQYLLAPAPAKLNLFLHITGRRRDGMHELQTLFQFLDWRDRLRFEPLEEQVIERPAGAPGIAPEQDLVLRAARLLAARSGHSGGVRVAVDKHLPIGGGLAVLGAELGADVPVFIGGRAAWAEGVGERLTPVADIAEPWYLVVWPKDVHVDTGKAFGDPNLTRHHPLVTIDDFSCGRCDNDFAAVVERRYPDIARIREWLERFAPTPGRLTGSGACLFAAFGSYEEAAALCARAPEA